MTLLLLYVSLALIFSFFCSIAEAVLLSVTPAYIATLEGEGRHSGTLLRRFKERLRFNSYTGFPLDFRLILY